jgi:hypothetical protein
MVSSATATTTARCAGLGARHGHPRWAEQSLVPFADPANEFAGSGYHGYRHLLIVQQARQQQSGHC